HFPALAKGTSVDLMLWKITRPFLISDAVHGKPCANRLIVMPPELHIITGSDTGIGGSIQLEGILWRRNRYDRGSGRSSNCSCKVVTMTKFHGNCTWHDER